MAQWRTPEALLPRSDSRLESETCAALCLNGRRCRRKRSPPSTPGSLGRDSTTDRLFCWQHQSSVQTPLPTTPTTPSRPVNTNLRRQSSIDTLAERMGILKIDSHSSTKKFPTTTRPSPRKGEALEEKTPRRRAPKVPEGKPERSKRPKQPGLLASLCCMGLSSDDDYEIIRHRRRPPPEKTPVSEKAPLPLQRPTPPRTPSRPAQLPLRNPWIPSHLPPRTIHLLETELSKPIARADAPGYIYMYWLTQQPASAPTVARLVDQLPPLSEPWESLSSTSASHRATQSTVSSSPLFADDTDEPSNIRVKIGRAANVHQRLAAWQRQCGHRLALLRFYPHVAGASQENVRHGGAQQHKVAFSHRVERLVQIELEGLRARSGPCASCGRVHREWFELDGTVEGLAAVDEVIKRWVAWAAQHRP